MKHNDTYAVRCPYRAGEPPEEMEYPCMECAIAWKPPKRRHFGKHLECTFKSISPGKAKKREKKLSTAREHTELHASKTKPAKAKKLKAAKNGRKEDAVYSEQSQRTRRSKKKDQKTSRIYKDYDYDGYYDDVLPLDNGASGQGVDTAMAQKIALLIVAVLLIVSACVAVMYFL